MGPSRSDYELVAPKNSFIHVDDFDSPKLLAEYLDKLDEDDELYNEYFRWKGTGTVISETRYYCRLCAMLHDEKRSPKYYEDINKWWNGSGVCIR
jgi:glycoprotein 3-alpha-L-fucosyltransferase